MFWISVRASCPLRGPWLVGLVVRVLAVNLRRLVLFEHLAERIGDGAVSAGTTWLKMAAGGERSSDSSYWVIIDEIVTGLTYATNETVLAGLAYNAAPAETLDGVSVRTAVGNATRSEILARLNPPQLSRYHLLLQDFTGARIIVAVGDDAIPRRMAVTPTGTGYYPTIEMDYTGWATTTVAIAAPSGPDVRDYP